MGLPRRLSRFLLLAALAGSAAAHETVATEKPAPMPANTGEVVHRYAKVLIPELNTGQLAMLILSAHLVDARTFSKVQGQPIFAEELEDEISKVMDGDRDKVMDG